MKVEQLVKLISVLSDKEESESEVCMWQVGKNYFIRTVTMHLTGELIAVTDKELLIKNAA